MFDILRPRASQAAHRTKLVSIQEHLKKKKTSTRFFAHIIKVKLLFLSPG